MVPQLCMLMAFTAAAGPAWEVPQFQAMAATKATYTPFYQQLPSRDYCEMMHTQAMADRAALCERLALMDAGCYKEPYYRYDCGGGDGEMEDFRWVVQGQDGGGWAAARLREVIREADQIVEAWDLARKVQQYDQDVSLWQWREESAADLIDRIGLDAFWRGQLPLPLSWR